MHYAFSITPDYAMNKMGFLTIYDLIKLIESDFYTNPFFLGMCINAAANVLMYNKYLHFLLTILQFP